MAGRKPKLDGEKAMAGAAGLIADGMTLAEAAGIKPPTTLDRWGKEEWHRLVAMLAPKGNLSIGDLGALEMLCHAFQRWKHAALRMKRAGADGPYQVTPQGYGNISAENVELGRAAKEYRSLAGEFGVTPVARIKTTGTAQGDLPFDDLPLGGAAAERDPTDPLSLH